MRRPESSSGKSPVIAAVLAVVYPGLGHVYLRRWGRALLWFVLVVASVVTLIPASAVPGTLSFQALLEARAALPPGVILLALTLSATSAVDAYWLATRDAGDEEEPDDAVRTCPNCGKEIDADLDFCHWCTTNLDEQ